MRHEGAGRRRAPIIAILVAYAVLAGAYSVIMPLGEAPDEVSHYSYARFMAEHWALPSPAGPARGEVFQPPLYYALGALATAWIPDSGLVIKANNDFTLAEGDVTPNVLLHTHQEDLPYQGDVLAWHLMRLISVALGAVTVWATYALTRLVFPGRPYLALGAAAFNAFLPEFLFLSGSFNNDTLVATLSGLTLLQIVRVVTGEGTTAPRAASWVSLGLLLGLGFWTKMSMLAFWPLAGLAVVMAAPREAGGKAAGRIARAAVLTGAPALLVAAPWAVHNLLASGDPLGWGILRQVTDAVTGPLSLADYQRLATQFYQSFWGRFGGAAQVTLPAAVYAGLGALTAVALAGDLRLAWRMWRGGGNPTTMWAAALLGLHGLIIAGLLLIWWNTNQGTGQGRLAYPTLSAISVFFAAGLAAWLPGAGRDRSGRGWGPLAMAGLAGGMLVLSATVLFGYLQPMYGPAPRIALTDVPAAARRGPFDFGGEIRLLGWSIERNILAPGDVVSVTLYWQALQNPPEDYRLLLLLQHDADEPVWNKDGSPSAGRDSTDQWHQGDVIFARHRLALAADAPTGHYRLLAGVHPFGQWQWLMIRDEAGKELGDTIALEDLAIRGGAAP
jgi:hypothetical protein